MIDVEYLEKVAYEPLTPKQSIDYTKEINNFYKGLNEAVAFNTDAYMKNELDSIHLPEKTKYYNDKDPEPFMGGHTALGIGLGAGLATYAGLGALGMEHFKWLPSYIAGGMAFAKSYNALENATETPKKKAWKEQHNKLFNNYLDARDKLEYHALKGLAQDPRFLEYKNKDMRALYDDTSVEGRNYIYNVVQPMYEDAARYGFKHYRD